jgi:hypothetical protein
LAPADVVMPVVSLTFPYQVPKLPVIGLKQAAVGVVMPVVKYHKLLVGFS